jgi:voltage-gated potassium channel
VAALLRFMKPFGSDFFTLQVKVALSMLVATIAVGTVSYHYIEDWSWASSFYFTVCTLTTVGYGDLYPTTEFSRLFTAIFTLAGVSIAFTALGVTGATYLRAREKQLSGLLLSEKKTA